MSGSDWSESSAWVTIPDDMLLDLIELGETVKEDDAWGPESNRHARNDRGIYNPLQPY